MANIIGDLVYRITGDSSKLDGTVKKTDKEVKGLGTNLDNTSKKSNLLSGALKGIGAVAVIGAIVATAKAVFKVSKEFVNASSLAEETANKFNVTFGAITATANATAEEFVNTYKLARSEAQGLLAGTGDILTGFGFTQQKALELSESTLKLSADLASFQNIAGGVPEVADRITRALTGETEGLKALGIVVRQDSDEFKKLVKDIQDTTGANVQLAKSQAILQTALIQSKNSSNDFLKTQDSYQNIIRQNDSLTLRISESIGKVLLPVFAAGEKVINGFLNALANALDPTRAEKTAKAVKELTELEAERLPIQNEIDRLNRNILLREKQIAEAKGDPRIIKNAQQGIEFAKKAIANLTAEGAKYDLLNKKIESKKKQIVSLDDTAQRNAEAEQARLTDEAEKQKQLATQRQIDADKKLELEKGINEAIKKGLSDLEVEKDLNGLKDEERAEQTKAIYLSAIKEANALFGSADEFTKKLLETFSLLPEKAKESVDALGTAFGAVKLGIGGAEGSSELKVLVSSFIDLGEAIADFKKNGEDAKITANDWISIIVQLVQALDGLVKKAELEQLEKGNRRAATFLTVIKGLLAPLTDLKFLFSALLGPLGTVLYIIGRVNRLNSDTAEQVQAVNDAISELESSTELYVNNLETQLLEKAVDIWGEYAKSVLDSRILLDSLLAKQDEKEAARLKAKQDEEIATYTDLLNTSTDEKEKALAREAIDEIETERAIAKAKADVAKDEADIDKKIALVKLSIKKSQLEADFQVKFAELQANESSAIADASGIRKRSERREQVANIREAYGSAYAAIGKAATSTGASLELERKSITGGLTADDFTDSQSDANTRIKALEQPIVITIDGKTVAETVATYGANALVEFTK